MHHGHSVSHTPVVWRDCGAPTRNGGPEWGRELGLKVVYFGSPEDAVPALESLVAAGHDVASVYTRPDRAAGRSRRPRPTPVRLAAESLGLHVETPSGLRDAAVQHKLSEISADVFIVVAYGRILPPEILEMPRLGVVNIHPSLLPRHRGPSPVSTAILEGDSETGVTVMLLDEGMDSGPLLVQSEPVPITGVERAGELTARLFAIGAGMLPDVLEKLEQGSVIAQQQDESLVTITRLVEKDDGRIDWSRDTAEIERMTRAYDPWPGAFTSLRGKNLKVIVASQMHALPATGRPGLVRVSERRIFVATGDGALELIEVQPEGKRRMTARDLINGTPNLHRSLLGE